MAQDLLNHGLFFLLTKLALPVNIKVCLMFVTKHGCQVLGDNGYLK